MLRSGSVLCAVLALLPVCTIATTLGTTSDIIVVPSPSTWAFNDAFACTNGSGAVPGGWPSPDVSSWSSGATPLGFGLSADTAFTAMYDVDVDGGMRGVQRAPTAYFQTTFLLTGDQVASVLSASMSFTAGDGVVVYLNGVEGACVRGREGMAD